MLISHLSTEEWIDSLKLQIVDDWEPRFVQDQVAGLVPFFYIAPTLQ